MSTMPATPSTMPATPSTMPEGPALYSIPRVVEQTGLSRTQIYEEIASGRLRAVRVGRRRFVVPIDLASWIDALPS